MKSRGRSRSRTSDGIQLTDYTHRGHDSEHDIYPHSDASYLRRHRSDDDNEDDESDTSGSSDNNGTSVTSVGIITRFIAFMSRSPLLRGGGPSSAARRGSYGALPHEGYDDNGNDNVDDIRKRDRRKGTSSALRPAASMSTFKSRTRKESSRSGSGFRDSLSGSRSSPELGAETGYSTGQGGELGGGVLFGAEGSESGLAEEIISLGEDFDEDDPLDNSAYPQVRASVAATDDVSASINTPRMWTLSLLCALLGSATNLFFSLRYPSVAITPVIALVIVHPLGRAWDKVLKYPDDPPTRFEYGVRIHPSKGQDSDANLAWARRLRLWLAQGRWNEKEHACVYISSNVSFGFAFATDVIVEQSKFYHQELTITYQLLLTISTQVLGYSFAGLTRRFLVRPPSMIWPGILMSTAMFTTMHKSENKEANGWNITRWRFFLFVWSGAFAWYFLPGLLMPALSYFNVITWFAPENVVVANLFGVRSGLGLFPMTFDWAQIAYIGSPLLTPWWAAANVVGGLVIVMWFVAPILYYTNTLFSAYLPILSASVFDNFGKAYDVSKILTPDYHFDHEAYTKYSKVYLPITYVLSYAVQFASLSALVTHTICWHGSDIWQQSKKSFEGELSQDKTEYQVVNQSPKLNSRSSTGASRRSNSLSQDQGVEAAMEGEDVHNRLMKRYEDAPISWYLTTFVTMLAIGIFVVEYYPIYLPWYGLLLALSITALLFIPVGIVMAITNQHSSLYLICQLICGAVFPGRPVANMVFVTYCYISSAQGIKFSSDLKLGHYMKIPPRLLFRIQLTATLLSSFVQIGVLNWMFASIPSLCTEDALNGFTCPLARVHFNGSILWGVVGPRRFFGQGALYRPLIWAFLVGAIMPVVVWTIGRRRESESVWRKINLPVLFGSLSWIPPATGLNFSVWALTCYLFNSHLRRRTPAWWGKYTMTLSAALDSGLAFGVVVVFFGFLYPAWGWVRGLEWWGSRVFQEGCDWRACAYLALAPGERFDRPAA